MVPGGDDNGWWHWRGQTDSRLQDAEEDVRAFWAFKDSTDKRFATIDMRLLALIALAAGVGAQASNFIAAIIGIK